MNMRLLACAALGLAVCGPAMADRTVHDGNLTIRCNALSASHLPEVSTRALGVKRDPSQGLLNVVVTRGKGPEAPNVAADVSARAMTSNGTPVHIAVQSVTDSGGVSYVGSFHIPSTDTLRFDVDVTPQGGTTRHLHFKQAFVVP